MSKTVTIRLTCSGGRTGPFALYLGDGTLLGDNIIKEDLINGYAVSVPSNTSSVVLTSKGKCSTSITIPVVQGTVEDLAAITYTPCNTASLWRHLTDITVYNYYYGNIAPYIIEYPFSYETYDEILQNVKDYTRSYKYLPILDGVYNANTKIEVDNEWFNKAILYNGQQSTGVLELVPKPINNLRAYLNYPLYNVDSKTILYTKSDNFYQYNTFWGLVRNKNLPLFNTTCESLSIDKVVNQANMDYGKRSFKKEPLRAKGLKVRHILDDKYQVHLVSQFILTPSEISYK